MYDYCIYSYRDFWEKHSCFWCSAHIPAKAGTDAGLAATSHGWLFCSDGDCFLLLLSEFLEHLASYNGADMHKYNLLYTKNQPVWTP